MNGLRDSRRAVRVSVAHVDVMRQHGTDIDSIAQKFLNDLAVMHLGSPALVTATVARGGKHSSHTGCFTDSRCIRMLFWTSPWHKRCRASLFASQAQRPSDMDKAAERDLEG